MPKKTEPTTDLQIALSRDFERLTRVRRTISRIAKIIEGLSAEDQLNCLGVVTDAVQRSQSKT